MNAMTQVANKAANSLTVSNFSEAMRLAEMMSQGSLVPQHLQGKPADCLMVVEQAVRWNCSPFAVAQCTSVISGKLMFEGKLVAAVVNASARLVGSLRHEFHGEGATRSVVVSGLLVGEDEPRTAELALKDAKTTNGMWTKQPDQQLVYAGSRVWARRHTPEVMLGIYSPEEMQTEPPPARHVQAEQVHTSRPSLPGGLGEHVRGMEQPAKLPIIAPNTDLIAIPKGKWLAAVSRAVASMESGEAVREWRSAMGVHLGSIAEAGDADLVTQAEAIITARMDSFADPTPDQGDAHEGDAA